MIIGLLAILLHYFGFKIKLPLSGGVGSNEDKVVALSNKKFTKSKGAIKDLDSQDYNQLIDRDSNPGRKIASLPVFKTGIT